MGARSNHRVHHMRINRFFGAAAVAAAALAGAASTAALAGEQLSSAQVAERTGTGPFEFRGRTQVWRFTPDGRVAADYTVSRISMGGMGEQFGLKASGTWRRDGGRLCVDWQQGTPARSGCYTVTTGRGSMVFLMGPQAIEGTLEATTATPATGLAERPAPRSAPRPRPFGR